MDVAKHYISPESIYLMVLTWLTLTYLLFLLEG
jgi:hypothetical protein